MTFPFAVRALHLLFFLLVGTFRFPKTMKIRYSAEVDPDVDYPKQEFLDLLQIYLADPDGWESKGYSFVYDPKGPVKIRLSSPATIAKTCGLPGNLSCAELGGLKGCTPNTKVELEYARPPMPLITRKML